MKTCSKCSFPKSLDSFDLHATCKGGRNSQCKACRKSTAAARYAANPGPFKTRARAWSTKNPEEARRHFAKADERYRKTEKGKRKIRENHLQRRYGMSLDDYDKLFERQQGRCAVCRKEFAVLHVDHDHVTGKVRGLLCGNHNRALGLLQDSRENISALLRYVTEVSL